MAYSTLDDLKTRDSEADLIALTDPAGVAVQAAVVTQAIAIADSLVDSYLGTRLRVPLTADELAAAPAVKHHALIVARWYLYADRKTEAVIAEYEEAMRWLRDVQAGKASTSVVQAPEGDDLAQGTAVFAPVRKPLFGTDFETRYDVPMGPNGSGEVFIGR